MQRSQQAKFLIRVCPLLTFDYLTKRKLPDLIGLPCIHPWSCLHDGAALRAFRLAVAAVCDDVSMDGIDITWKAEKISRSPGTFHPS